MSDAATISPATSTLAPVTLTDSAVRRIAHVLQKEAPGAALRVAVNGGGCSGFSYAFEVTPDRGADDLVLAREGAIVLVDSVSLEYLAGSQIDFADDLIGQSFKIHNPNATSSCGCGTSFSL